jgi:hypothetical protein
VRGAGVSSSVYQLPQMRLLFYQYYDAIYQSPWSHIQAAQLCLSTDAYDSPQHSEEGVILQYEN